MAKNNIATKTDIDRLENQIKKLDSRMLDTEVKILGELKDMREDSAAHQFSHMRTNEDLIDHDNRLKKLETAKI